MPTDKVVIEVSREDAKWMDILLGSINSYDTAAILSHTQHTSADEMYYAFSALQHTYYQFRVALEGRKPNP